MNERSHAQSSESARKLAELSIVAQREFDGLVAIHRDQKRRGGTLFLGPHYALRPGGILMLGINPGGPDYCFTTVPPTYNCLLTEYRSGTYAYWRNARKLFTSTAPLENAMRDATFSFCCPFRTSNWNGQPRALREALIRHSKPILLRMIEDCAPSLIVVAGVAGEMLLRSMLRVELEGGRPAVGSGDPKGAYQWCCYPVAFNGRKLTIAQVPHFSRANSRERLAQCGAWLTTLLPT